MSKSGLVLVTTFLGIMQAFICLCLPLDVATKKASFDYMVYTCVIAAPFFIYFWTGEWKETKR